MDIFTHLQRLVRLGRRFRNTSIVDDDFPQIRNEFDAALQFTEKELSKPRPKIVCLCGSTRFYKEFQEANYRETMAGNIILSVGFYPHISQQRVKVDGCMGEEEAIVTVVHGEHVGCSDEQKKALDRLHFRKIELADEIFVLNVTGYIGESTRNEISYAKELGKPIRYLVKQS